MFLDMPIRILRGRKMPKSFLSELNFEAGLACIDAVDYENAFEFFQKAASQNHAGAQFYLGIMYLNGLGLPRSREDALVWLEKASCQDHVEALRELNLMKEGEKSFAEEPPDNFLEQLYQRGLVAEDLGFYYQAIALWKRVLELDICHVGALEALARTYTRAGKPKLARIYAHMAGKISTPGL